MSTFDGRRDRRGRPYTLIMFADPKLGEPPPNKGQTFPPEIYTRSEVAAIMGKLGRGLCGDRDRAQVVTMYRAGCRIAESLALLPRDIDLAAGTITIRHAKGDRPGHVKRRVVGIDPEGAAVIDKWLTGRARLGLGRNAPVFCTVSSDHKGWPVQSSVVRDKLKLVGWKAGVDKRVHPHGFRHTYAVELLREGVSVLHISKMLGHTDLATTVRYLDHLLPAELVEIAHQRTWDGRPAGRDQARTYSEDEVQQLLAQALELHDRRQRDDDDQAAAA